MIICNIDWKVTSEKEIEIYVLNFFLNTDIQHHELGNTWNYT